MDKEFLNKQEEKLQKIKESLEHQLKSFAKEDKNLKHNWKSSFPEFDGSETGDSSLEVAQDEVEEYMGRLPVEHALEIKLKNVNLAIERIKKNTYGKCEKCKKPIPLDRLNVCPEARLCLECEKK